MTATGVPQPKLLRPTVSTTAVCSMRAPRRMSQLARVPTLRSVTSPAMRTSPPKPQWAMRAGEKSSVTRMRSQSSAVQPWAASWRRWSAERGWYSFMVTGLLQVGSDGPVAADGHPAKVPVLRRNSKVFRRNAPRGGRCGAELCRFWGEAVPKSEKMTIFA